MMTRRERAAQAWDAVEVAYLIHSSQGYLTAAGTWAAQHMEARPYSEQDASELDGLPHDAKFVGPYWLDAWGNVAENQI